MPDITSDRAFVQDKIERALSIPDIDYSEVRYMEIDRTYICNHISECPTEVKSGLETKIHCNDCPFDTYIDSECSGIIIRDMILKLRSGKDA